MFLSSSYPLLPSSRAPRAPNGSILFQFKDDFTPEAGALRGYTEVEDCEAVVFGEDGGGGGSYEGGGFEEVGGALGGEEGELGLCEEEGVESHGWEVELGCAGGRSAVVVVVGRVVVGVHVRLAVIAKTAANGCRIVTIEVVQNVFSVWPTALHMFSNPTKLSMEVEIC